jgi:sugar lactone lactonase YvrE
MASLVLSGATALKTLSFATSDQAMSRAIDQRFDQYKTASANGETEPTLAETCYRNLRTCVTVTGVAKTPSQVVLRLAAKWHKGERTLEQRKVIKITAGAYITGYSENGSPIWGVLTSSNRGRNISTLAGSGTAGATNALGEAASFSFPAGAAVDSRGNVYVADTGDNCIRMVTPTGSTTTLAGSGATGAVDGIGSAATFTAPFGVAVDASNTVYVADSGSNRIRKVATSGYVTTIAGSGGPGRFADGTGVAAKFSLPTGVAVNAAGTVFIADSGNNRIRSITPAGVVTTFAGSGAAGSVDGKGAAASFNDPRGVAIDTSGFLYVTSFAGNIIRKISPEGVVTTFAGSGVAGSSNGQGTAATFDRPSGIAVDRAGNVFVSETAGESVRKITPTGAVSSYTNWIAGGPGLVTLTKPSYGATSPVHLGAAEPFSVLGGSSVTNSGDTVLNGQLGVSPGTTINGQSTVTFAGTVNAENSAAARTDLQEAMVQGEQTISAGVYSALDLTSATTLTLDGRNDPNAVFIFQISGNLTTEIMSTVRLINSAQPANVFWVVTGTADIGPLSTFVGQILSTGAITVSASAKVDGRALGLSTVSLTMNTFTGTAPVTATSSYTVAGGSGLAADASGTIYSADSSSHRIWKIQ